MILVCLALVAGVAAADPGFQSVTLLFNETWTGNAYVPDGVTGSEPMPLDVHAGAGARFNLVDPFIFPAMALTVDPRLVLGARRFLLFESGRVVPTQLETGLGDENGLPGLGAARVMSVAVSSPVSVEFRLGEAVALSFGVSPTVLFRIRAGDPVFQNSIDDLAGMYTFFYGNLRWLRPEIHLATRFTLSDYFAFALRATSSVSILDIADPALPWWDQMQISGALEASLTPPFSGLFRGLRQDEGN